MSIIERKIEKASNDSVLIQFLGIENVEDMKRRIVDIIVDQIRDDMRDYSDYLVRPEDIIATLIDNISDSVRDRVQEKLEKVVMKRAMKALELEIKEDI